MLNFKEVVTSNIEGWMAERKGQNSSFIW